MTARRDDKIRALFDESLAAHKEWLAALRVYSRAENAGDETAEAEADRCARRTGAHLNKLLLKLAAIPATSIYGVAMKLRLAVRYGEKMGHISDKAEQRLRAAAWRDAERLAGTGKTA